MFHRIVIKAECAVNVNWRPIVRNAREREAKRRPSWIAGHCPPAEHSRPAMTVVLHALLCLFALILIINWLAKSYIEGWCVVVLEGLNEWLTLGYMQYLVCILILLTGYTVNICINKMRMHMHLAWLQPWTQHRSQKKKCTWMFIKHFIITNLRKTESV